MIGSNENLRVRDRVRGFWIVCLGESTQVSLFRAWWDESLESSKERDLRGHRTTEKGQSATQSDRGRNDGEQGKPK